MYLGTDSDFPPPKEGNPEGIFERKEILAFNGKCIESLYLGHDRPDLLAMEQHPSFSRMADEAAELLRSIFADRPLWGWKEPITTLLTPIYQAALGRGDVRESYVLSVRRPAEVFASQKKIMDTAETHREAAIGARAYRRWASYTIKSLKFSRGKPRAMVAFHELVADPQRVLSDVHRGLFGGAVADAFVLEAATKAIHPEHHRNLAVEEVPADAPAIVARLWQLCKRAAADVDGLNEGKYDSEAEDIEREFELLSTCFAEPEPPFGQITFQMPGGPAVVYGSVLPSLGWNTVEAEISARPNVDLYGSLYPLPANVYVRDLRFGEGHGAMKAVNDTAQSVEGVATRFSLGFSHPQVSLRTPVHPGPYKLRMEVYVEMNIFTALDSLLRQTRKTRQLESQNLAGNEYVGRLEQDKVRLYQEIEHLKKRK